MSPATNSCRFINTIRYDLLPKDTCIYIFFFQTVNTHFSFCVCLFFCEDTASGVISGKHRVKKRVAKKIPRILIRTQLGKLFGGERKCGVSGRDGRGMEGCAESRRGQIRLGEGSGGGRNRSQGGVGGTASM